MRESDVVGIKDALECRKNYPIVFCQLGECMEQIHDCSSNRDSFRAIRFFSMAWFAFHILVLRAFFLIWQVRCLSREKSFKQVTTNEWTTLCWAEIVKGDFWTLLGTGGQERQRLGFCEGRI
jgi:hypothetical protein